jgi:hypothetical protein
VFLKSLLIKYDQEIDTSEVYTRLNDDDFYFSKPIATFLSSSEYQSKIEMKSNEIENRINDYYRLKLEKERPYDCEILIGNNELK